MAPTTRYRQSTAQHLRSHILDFLHNSKRFPRAAFISSFWFAFSAYSIEYVRKGEHRNRKRKSTPRQFSLSYARNLLIVLLFLLSGCSPHVQKEQSLLAYYPTETERLSLADYPEKEAPISHSSQWGREMLIGREFAKEGDWYRALTSFRKARILLQLDNALTQEREARLAWSEALIYGFSGKWKEVLSTWERYRDRLPTLSPAMQEQWVILLYAAYMQEARKEEAEALMSSLSQESPVQHKLHEWTRLSLLNQLPPPHEQASPLETSIISQMKSPMKAKVMNALLPGLGYLYAGQKQTALTSFLLNACFIGAGIQLFHAHQTFLALITLSFEAGWYFGGITGAGLAADEYNEAMKKKILLPYLRSQKSFPLLQIGIGW